MNATPSEGTGATPEDALKRRLLNRIAIAAVMVVGLLGSLAIFDAVYAPGKRPAKTAAAPPASETPAEAEAKPGEPAPAVPPISSISVPPALSAAASAATVTPTGAPAANATATTAAAPAATVAAPSPKPGPTPGPTPAPTPTPKVVAEGTSAPGAPPLQPLPPEKGLTKPANKQSVAVRPSEPLPAVGSAAARPEPGRALARAPQAPGVAPRAPASRPLTRTGEYQFALQMGVFNAVANAEDLRAKLELHGIPSTIEARVHVGPFASREEADAARAKLKELGLDSGLLVTLKK